MADTALPFYHRERELADISRVTAPAQPVLLLIYGRRRVGKSRLIKHWARNSGLPFFYWESPRQNAEQVRASLVREFLIWRGMSPALADDRALSADWLAVFRMMRRELGTQPAVVALDEFPWAVEADPGLPSILKNAWDNVFADSQIKLFLAGSHISAMEKLMQSDAPLFGRLSAKLHVRPFTLPQIGPYLRAYSPEKRLAVYSILGGVPDYLQRWNDREDLLPNIQRLFVSELTPLRNEREILISDVLRRESHDYESVLSAIGHGHHDLDAIVLNSRVDSSARAASVLDVLTDVRLVENRVRASVPPIDHRKARYTRYFLADPILRFYYRFVEPLRSRIEMGLQAEIERVFREQLRGFVGYAFEEQCREWMRAQARKNELPFVPDYIGSDWASGYQVDIAAINWQTRHVAIGEAKWTDEAFDQTHMREFQSRQQRMLERLRVVESTGETRRAKTSLDWTVHPLLFVRRGLTDSARAAARATQTRVVTFAELVKGLTGETS